jgi:hypothetical protein
MRVKPSLSARPVTAFIGSDYAVLSLLPGDFAMDRSQFFDAA